MVRKSFSTSKPNSAVIDEALNAMEAEKLRELIRGIIPWLDDKTHARLVNELIGQAARGDSGWTPTGPCEKEISEIVTFAKAATRVGYAEPSQVDDYLRRGTNAFLGKNYPSAVQIFHSLLIPVSVCDIDLGQQEMIEEVLNIDVADCAAQYVISVYMTSELAHRTQAVYSAIEQVRHIGNFYSPLAEMQRVAVEPLPEFDDFLVGWRAFVEEKVGELRRDGRDDEWDRDQDRWLREVVQRIEGTDGLAEIARLSKRGEDLRAWCDALIEDKRWKEALAAYEEAAELVADKTLWRGDFLDGAALAAQELGSKDLPIRLERSWRTDPSLLRLRRWLGSSKSKAVVIKRAAEAVKVCPKEDLRQRAFLYILLEDLQSAAKLLASAPGLGWSETEHPAHLLFPIFCRILGAEDNSLTEDDGSIPDDILDIDERWPSPDKNGEAHLDNPHINEILEVANIGRVTNAKDRATVLKAMRAAAEKRIEGVIEKKRRRYYGHAASLATACVAIDPSQATKTWLDMLGKKYRRYPSFQRELARNKAR
jgi:hypothetical protein